MRRFRGRKRSGRPRGRIAPAPRLPYSRRSRDPAFGPPDAPPTASLRPDARVAARAADTPLRPPLAGVHFPVHDDLSGVRGGATQPHDAGGSVEGHGAGNARPAARAPSRIPLPPSSEGPAGEARSRLPVPPESHLRPRLLVAPARLRSRTPAPRHPTGLLASQVEREPSPRPGEPAAPRSLGLGSADRLGMRSDRPQLLGRPVAALPRRPSLRRFSSSRPAMIPA